MRIKFIAMWDEEEDGVGGSVSMIRENVDDLYSLLNAYQAFTVSTGFTYSEAIGCNNGTGDTLWSDF